MTQILLSVVVLHKSYKGFCVSLMRTLQQNKTENKLQRAKTKLELNQNYQKKRRRAYVPLWLTDGVNPSSKENLQEVTFAFPVEVPHIS